MGSSAAQVRRELENKERKMPVHNSDIANILSKMADLLEIEGANQFRVRAYRNASRTIGSHSRSIAEMVDDGESLSDLPGIGKSLAEKIEEIVENRGLEQLEELEERVAPHLDELLKIPGLGPKRVKKLYSELDVNDLDDLKKAAQEGKIVSLEGFGEKTEKSILEELEKLQESEERTRFVVAEEVSKSLVDHLKRAKGVKEIAVAGSFRRRKETVGDLDILVTCKEASREKIMKRFVEYEDVQQVVSEGKTRSTVILHSGLQVDLRAVAQTSYGAALHYFTGSKAHNIAIRRLGVKRHYKINEYGVFKGKKRIAGKTEEEVYAAVDLPFIDPELREDRGEIEAAAEDRLPDLLDLQDIRGDLHSHTKDTDGKYSLEEMVEGARKRGYEYLAISNHSKHLSVARGFDRERLAKQIEEIDRLNETLKDFIVLKAIEVDILEDGSLDLPDSILEELDLTVCSVHFKFNLSREKQTRRILRAMENPHFNILGHPTGRLIHEREPYQVDMEKLMKEALDRGCFMELNAQPDRLDLPDNYCKMAKEMGVKLAISTDAHSLDDLDYMRFGVGQARRGWLEREDVLNTRPWKELKGLLKENR